MLTSLAGLASATVAILELFLVLLLHQAVNHGLKLFFSMDFGNLRRLAGFRLGKVVFHNAHRLDDVLVGVVVNDAVQLLELRADFCGLVDQLALIGRQLAEANGLLAGKIAGAVARRGVHLAQIFADLLLLLEQFDIGLLDCLLVIALDLILNLFCRFIDGLLRIEQRRQCIDLRRLISLGELAIA